MEEKQAKQWNLKRIVLVISVIGYICFLVWLYYWWVGVLTAPIASTSPPLGWYVSFTCERDDGYYNLTVETAWGEEHMTLDNVEIWLRCNGTTFFSERLDHLLNNESSPVVYYDKDNNKTLSVGDVFKVRSDVVKPGTIFEYHLISEYVWERGYEWREEDINPSST